MIHVLTILTNEHVYAETQSNISSCTHPILSLYTLCVERKQMAIEHRQSGSPRLLQQIEAAKSPHTKCLLISKDIMQSMLSKCVQHAHLILDIRRLREKRYADFDSMPLVSLMFIDLMFHHMLRSKIELRRYIWSKMIGAAEHQNLSGHSILVQQPHVQISSIQSRSTSFMCEGKGCSFRFYI